MKWFDIFKLYNLKKLKSEKVIFLFISLSIFIITLISLLVPQVTENTKEYMYSSVEKLNGADLMVKGLIGEISNSTLSVNVSQGDSGSYDDCVRRFQE